MKVKWTMAFAGGILSSGAGDRRSEAQTGGAYGVCRAALPFEGPEDARPGVAPAPAFGGPLSKRARGGPAVRVSFRATWGSRGRVSEAPAVEVWRWRAGPRPGWRTRGSSPR